MVVAHAQLMPVPGRSNGSLPYPLLQEFESSDARNSVCACDEDVSRRTRAWRLELAARSHRGARAAIGSKSGSFRSLVGAIDNRVLA